MATAVYPPSPVQMPTRAIGEKFRPVVGLPEIVALQFEGGKSVQSRITGDRQTLLTFTDGRQWYVSPILAAHITQLGIRARQQFEVLKLAAGNFQITPLQAHLANPRGEERNTGGDRPQTAPPARSPNPGYANDNQPASHDGNYPEVGSAASCMCAAMRAAVDAVIATQEYARQKNLGVTFGEESVRAIGLSIYIQGCKGGGR